MLAPQTSWLSGAGRFSYARKVVRFARLDITVYSSDSERSPGHLSRQGPEGLRWVVSGIVLSLSSAPLSTA